MSEKNIQRTSRCDFPLLRQFFLHQAGLLIALVIVRLSFLYFSPAYPVFPLMDFLRAMWLGLRIDLVLIAYLSLLPFLLIVANALLFHLLPSSVLRWILLTYLVVTDLGLFVLVVSDLAFYSYFGEHMNILIFGVFDDDTRALWQVAQKNYSLPMIGGVVAALVGLIIYADWRLLKRLQPLARPVSWRLQVASYLSALFIVLLLARGSLGTFPLIKDVPEVSADPFINSLPMNAALAFQKAEEQYRASKADRFDLAAAMGYGDDFRRAISDFLGYPLGSDEEPVRALLRRSAAPHADERLPNVVVVMVESFGMPILRHQSTDFDILGRLARHFREDILFENFISGGNGTISSLEPLLLNVFPRPGSVPLSQSLYQRVAFPFAAARVFDKAGYTTRFVYGGDLSWRNIGSFLRLQGFDKVEGKAAIEKAVTNVRRHDWGVFDEYAYRYVLKILNESRQPQFIFLLTTNNHPPYTVPEDYNGPELKKPIALQKIINNDNELLRRRLRDYRYALDAAGGFMDAIKSSKQRKHTVVAITGDNNTIEGIMNYANPVAEAKRVPFYLYLPSGMAPKSYDRNAPGSHKDIFPTLYERILPDRPYLALGEDMFNNAVQHCGFNDAGVIVSRDGAFKLGKAKTSVQKRCEQLYRSGMAITDFLLKQARQSPETLPKELW